MRFLFIDTCTERGIIAYGNQAERLFEHELPFGLLQSQFLLPYLEERLRPFAPSPPLEAIGVGIGPGSYTGIRLGVAVAQALAYAWDKPLIGLPSLESFVPAQPVTHFAALCDARIGGVYFQIGSYDAQGQLVQGAPQVAPLEEAQSQLGTITHVVTPHAKALQAKFAALHPHQPRSWEERAPSAQIALKKTEARFRQGLWTQPPNHLELLYLRQTAAEQEKQRNG